MLSVMPSSAHFPQDLNLACVFIDMDCFFASVEEKQQGLSGRALVVGGHDGRGAVCSANSAARALGVRSGESLSSVRRRFGSAVSIANVRMELYQAESQHVMSVLREFGLPMQQLSIDEAAIDARSAADKLGQGGLAGVRVAQRMRQAVRQECGLAMSVGVSRGVVTAKMAVEDAKPDGLRVVSSAEFEEWLYAKDLGCIPGVGPMAVLALRNAGYFAVRDISMLTEMELCRVLGRSKGAWLFGVLSGRYDRPDVHEAGSALSIGCERTLGTPVFTTAEASSVISQCVADVCGRALVLGLYAGGVRVKTTDSKGVGRSKQRSLGHTRDYQTVRGVSETLLGDLLSSTPGGSRLVGVSLYGLNDYAEPSLFDTETTELGLVVGSFVSHPVFGDGLVSVVGETYARVSFQDKRRDVAICNLIV